MNDTQQTMGEVASEIGIAISNLSLKYANTPIESDIKELHRLISTFMTVIKNVGQEQEARLDDIISNIKYLEFDLEATRRERDRFKDMLNG